MTKLYETYTCTVTEDEHGVHETVENHIYAVVESDDGEITVVPEIESTDPDDEPDFVFYARQGFTKPTRHRYYWADPSKVPADYFGGLPGDVVAAGLEAKAELIAELSDSNFTLYRDDLREAGKQLFERCSEIDKQYRCSDAEPLYDGGWRSNDRDQLAIEYGLDDEYLDWLTEGLQDIEDEENEDEDE